MVLAIVAKTRAPRADTRAHLSGTACNVSSITDTVAHLSMHAQSLSLSLAFEIFVTVHQ